MPFPVAQPERHTVPIPSSAGDEQHDGMLEYDETTGLSDPAVAAVSIACCAQTRNGNAYRAVIPCRPTSKRQVLEKTTQEGLLRTLASKSQRHWTI